MMLLAAPTVSVGWFLLLALLASCASPVVKREVFDAGVLKQEPVPADLVKDAADGETVVEPGMGWMATDTTNDLVFARYRPPQGEPFFCQVLESDPSRDRLVLQPLPGGEDPLQALARPDRVASLRQAARDWAAGAAGSGHVLELSLREVVADKRLGPPVPRPQRILATAMNYPTHLEHDLAIDPELIPLIARARPRVFQKHPPVSAPGQPPHSAGFQGMIGPFDDVRYPARIHLPQNEEGELYTVETNLDYEVEIAVVLARRLDWETVKKLSDAQLFEAVAGYLLVSDVKARNPQLFERALTRDQQRNEISPYLTGDPTIDDVLGDWNPDICRWWSYAASQGDYAALGPFFVANTGHGGMPTRSLLCARTYADPKERGAPIPAGRETGVFYLRQCSRSSVVPGYEDSLIWDVPTILRSIVDPEANALDPDGHPVILEPGDILYLGTPGGVVLTVTDRALVKFLDTILFWWDALDWHDAFFSKDHEKYLREGDQLFLWAEGLGFQRNRVVEEKEVLD